VLVVDDETDIRDVIRINLEHRGYHVVVARDGAEALEAVREHRPDAMFLDVMMPGIDGWQVLDQLKGSGPSELAGIPIVMVTARGDDIDRLRGSIDGALRYITKPFRPGELIAALEEVLAEGAAPEPVRRAQVQRQALVELARREKGGTVVDEPVIRLTRLERTPAKSPGRADDRRAAGLALEALSPKQADLLRALAVERSVSVVAQQLAVSRSNIYASLRRIARKLHLRGTQELLALVRTGALAPLSR
jgi:DNA-binding response OmpR family regulator